MAKARNEGAEVAKEEPVIGPKDSAQSVIDQQHEMVGNQLIAIQKWHVPELLCSHRLHMLTLDETTLFYYSLSLSKGKNASSLIQDWADYVDTTTNPKLRTNNARSTTSTRASSQATKVSSLSDQVTITSQKPAGLSKADLSIDNVTGGLADEDEVEGAERDEAIKTVQYQREEFGLQESAVESLYFDSLIPYPDILIFQNIVQVNVKVEDSPVQMKTQKAKSSAFSNKQLPKELLRR